MVLLGLISVSCVRFSECYVRFEVLRLAICSVFGYVCSVIGCIMSVVGFRFSF